MVGGFGMSPFLLFFSMNYLILAVKQSVLSVHFFFMPSLSHDLDLTTWTKYMLPKRQ